MDRDEAVSPAWLTGLLRDAGALTAGRVTSVVETPTSAFNSRTCHLAVELTADAHADVPRRLVLKRNTDQAWSREAGQVEAAFYQLVSAQTDPPSAIAACIASGVDPRSGNSFVLLPDLSETHEVAVTRAAQIAMTDGVPCDSTINAVVDALAEVHAYWWDRAAPTIPAAAWSRDEEGLEAMLNRRRAAWRQVLAAHGDWLPAHVIEFYERTLVDISRMWERRLRERMSARRNLTLVHGDSYFANFLVPTIPESHPTYLIDWQSPSLDLAAQDLVTLLATWWSPDQRHDQNRERRALARYHAQLLERGVVGFSLEDLHADYALCLVDWVLVPLQDAADGSTPEYWWPKMQCLIAAYNDWGCGSLLDH
jgi:hypothetical protein